MTRPADHPSAPAPARVVSPAGPDDAVAVHVVRYQCPYCRRTRARRAAARAHIARCWLNPHARACKTCDLYEPSEPGPYPEHPPWPQACTAGLDLAAGPRTDCPLWRPAEQ